MVFYRILAPIWSL